MKEFEKDWEKLLPELRKKILEENPDKPLEALKATKQMDEIYKNLLELLKITDSAIEHKQNEIKYMEGVIESKKLQKRKKLVFKRDYLKRYKENMERQDH